MLNDFITAPRTPDRAPEPLSARQAEALALAPSKTRLSHCWGWGCAHNTAFGQRNEKTTQETIAQRYTFQGRESSANSAAGAPMYYRNRMYSAGLGRFGRRDPVLGGDLLYNAYGFPGGNSVRRRDPLGAEEIMEPELPPPPPPPIIQDIPIAAVSARIAKIAFDVACNGTKIGKLSFARYSTTPHGADVWGGFIKDPETDYRKPPCCCDELRWVQVVSTNYALHLKEWKDVRFVDPPVEDDPNKEPFFWRTGKRPQINKQPADMQPEIDEHRNVNGYDLEFKDAPGRDVDVVNKAHPHLYWRAELCLVCVKRPDKGIERLKCVRYGFDMRHSDQEPVTVTLNPAAIQDAGTGSEDAAQTINAYGEGWGLKKVICGEKPKAAVVPPPAPPVKGN